jgi:hypothetical protein
MAKGNTLSISVLRENLSAVDIIRFSWLFAQLNFLQLSLTSRRPQISTQALNCEEIIRHNCGRLAVFEKIMSIYDKWEDC